MPPPRNDFPPPRPATNAVSPEPSRISWAIHGSQATGRRVAVQVSPSRIPRRSPTSAVAVGTDDAAQTTEPLRRYAPDDSASPGMNSRASAYWASGCSMATFGLYRSSICWASRNASRSVGPDTASRHHDRTRVANAVKPVVISSSISSTREAWRASDCGGSSSCSSV